MRLASLTLWPKMTHDSDRASRRRLCVLGKRCQSGEFFGQSAALKRKTLIRNDQIIIQISKVKQIRIEREHLAEHCVSEMHRHFTFNTQAPL